MADTAKAGTPIVARQDGPQFEKAAEVLTKRFKALREKATSANGELGTLFKSIEDDLNVNRWAAKEAIKLKVMDPERAQDRIRGLMGMLRVFELLPEADLVDLAEHREAQAGDTDIDVTPGDVADGQNGGQDNGDDFDRTDGIASVAKGAKTAAARAKRHLAGQK